MYIIHSVCGGNVSGKLSVSLPVLYCICTVHTIYIPDICGMMLMHVVYGG